MSSLKGRGLSRGCRPVVLLAFDIPCGQRRAKDRGSRRSARSVARTNGLDAGPARCMLSADAEKISVEIVWLWAFSKP